MAGLSGEQNQRLGNLGELCNPNPGLHPQSCFQKVLGVASQAAQMPTGNQWQMTVNRRQTVQPHQRQATPHRLMCQEGAPRSRGKLACCGVWEMSLVRGDRCWKMGGIQICRRDWEIIQDRCVLQTACHCTAAPLCPPCPESVLWWGEAPNIPDGYYKPKQLFGNGQERSMAFSLEQGRDATVSRVKNPFKPGTCPRIHPTPTCTH